MIRDNKLSFDILNIIMTKKEATDFVTNIDILINSLFNLKIDIEKKMAEILSSKQKQALTALIKKSGINLKDAMGLQNFLKELRSGVESLPVVALTLAFEPKEENIKNISDWFALNLKKEVLLEITVDPKIIAGAVVVFGGNYRDFSVKKILTEKFENGNFTFTTLAHE